MKILILDIGGTHVKIYGPGRLQPIKLASGPALTPKKMLKAVLRATEGLQYDAISIGYPGPVVHGKPVRDPANLGNGWVGFDFHTTFKRPLKVINDAAMQALGSYRGGRMLFLGLGTGLGSALIVEGVLEPLEVAHLPYKHAKTFEHYVGEAARKRLGEKKWSKEVFEVVAELKQALQADYVVLGGGNAKRLKPLPRATFLGGSGNARLGGLRLWRGYPQRKKVTRHRGAIEPRLSDAKYRKAGPFKAAHRARPAFNSNISVTDDSA
ncbi:MAG TPA: ROK family protein [Terriglobales bacterium]|nr:ROK family protein [Terriglobales bacterium]